MLFDKRLIKLVGLLLVSILIGCTKDSAEKLYATNDAAAEVLYETSLKSIIEEKCISCHIYHLEGTNRYDTYDKTKSAIDQMLERINATSNIVMPPADSAQLTDEEKAVFEDFLAILNTDVAEEEEEEDTDAVIAITWTAYKYPIFEDRAPVSGTFEKIEYTFNEDYESPIELLENAEVAIETSSVNVGDDSQKTSNVGLFFSTFTPSIQGEVVTYNDQEALINFTMNGISLNIPFEITVETDHLLLKGSIPNMSLFDWEDAYIALDNVCGAFHDNKVWEDIDVEVQIRFNEAL